MIITSVTPSRISPVGQGTITITGTALGAVQTVLVGGLACTGVVVVNPTTVTAQWPLRVSNGVYDWGYDTVDLSISDGVTTVVAAGAITWMTPIVLRGLQAFEDVLGAGNTNNGYFYNWSPKQIVHNKLDISTIPTNGLFPQCCTWVEAERLQLDESTSATLVYAVPGGVGAIKPVKDVTNVIAEAAALIADLVRALYYDISLGGNVLDARVTAKHYNLLPLTSGSYLAVQLDIEYRYEHIWTDSTQDTVWYNTQA